ncbi:type IX secretion system outer membrane channel protein PorV [Flavobacterium sp. MC2016-06]|uniref:type IX secretion system outer membrane channel protein PorV n=1 Tax=Flavobacterium sp. MC2016-06 TaxID=2676308 RepID=UPI0012BACD11|nr:type IX secretion system outer membrane channel protein PorV [Flavobacterium sp. MC2016-06]MBU3858114.1 type IX secretion system outer membrane channel protein PorV [Flavobacterium sp. MC2016-06]
MKKISLLLICFLTTLLAKAQETRPITTGVPFLLVAADARAAGLADQGVATSADVFSQQWNPAKYAFSEDKQGFSISYTPYLTDLANDISLGQLTYYNKIDERSAFAGSFRYFGFGGIELRQTGDPNEAVREVTPNEFALDGSYSLKLSETFSMGIAARFISSNLKVASETVDAKAAKTFAVDVSGFYQSEEIAYNDFNGRWRAGFNMQNLGQKISYDHDDISSNFLPANLRLGGGFDFILDDYNKVAVSVEFTKLLVPTPPGPGTPVDANGDGDYDDVGDISQQEANDISYNKYKDIGWVSGIFKSFGDAPGGFSEELKEITYSVAGEYVYQDAFAMRLGYFHESPEKGARKFFSLGAGFKYNVMKIDVSYLFSASKVKNPLENTLRFSLTFNFGDKYETY